MPQASALRTQDSSLRCGAPADSEGQKYQKYVSSCRGRLLRVASGSAGAMGTPTSQGQREKMPVGKCPGISKCLPRLYHTPNTNGTISMAYEKFLVIIPPLGNGTPSGRGIKNISGREKVLCSDV